MRAAAHSSLWAILGSSGEHLGPRTLQGVVITTFGGVTVRGWARRVALLLPSIGTTVKMP